MKRKISLYIAEQLVDLDDDSIILFNYTQEDLSNPTIVKNSFSKQITLKGTPSNNQIFGDVFRLDRTTLSASDSQSGAYFDPIRKTPFAIYIDTGEIIESGYVKLDNIDILGQEITYTITLYGGLGSFFYSLSYNENGDKLTLADLDYLNTAAPADELTYTINATSVQDAWTALGNVNYSGKWNVINFAPAYNGIPDTNFSADKGLIVPTAMGLDNTITEEGTTYTLKDGYALATLSEKVSEWAAKDLRSYLQRPVFSLKAFLTAITNSANNGGYEVDLSGISSVSNYFNDLWMTLPMLPSLGTYKQTSGSASVTKSGSWSTDKLMATYTLSGVSDLPAGTTINTRLNISLRQKVNTALSSYGTLYNQQYYTESSTVTNYLRSVAFIQAVAYDSSDAVVGGSKVQCIGYIGANVSTIQEAATKFGYTPVYSDSSVWGDSVTDGNWTQVDGQKFKFSNDLSLYVSAVGVSYYKIWMSSYTYSATSTWRSGGSGGRMKQYWTESNITGGTNGQMRLYNPQEATTSTLVGYTSDSAAAVSGSVDHQITYESSSTLRSNAVITKQTLLSSTDTPAQFLLSFCKVFGLYFLYDNATKKVSIVSRNGLYQNNTIDLTNRIDRAKGIKVTPFVFDAKWYDFALESVGGEFSDEYEAIQGKTYGSQRVNTGFEFNSDTTEVMDSVTYKQALPALEHNKYWSKLTKGTLYYPTPFLDTGAKYTLWSSANEELETDIGSVPADVTISYYNTDRNGYDIEGAVKLQMHDSSQKPLNGEYCLCLLNGFQTYADFRLSDDLNVMDSVNDGTPCWILGKGSGVTIPLFSKYKIESGAMTINLDFGTPAEVNIPDMDYYADTLTIYQKSWKTYLSDRYNRDTKIMTCYVNFAGVQVSQSLLRQFYYYDNSLWVLNKISNYSLTTFDPVECEFIKVQGKTNYTNGQNL